MQTAPEQSQRESQGIQSMELGLRVLDVLARAHGPMALRDLSAAAGLSPSKVHRYLVSLRRCGYVQQDRASGKYDLGERSLHLGLSAMNRLNTVRIATDAAIELNQRTDRTVLVSIWGERGPTVIGWYDSSEIVVCNLSVGSIFPLLYTATGRVFLAYLPQGTTAAFVAAELSGAMAKRPMSRIRTQGDVDVLVRRVRRNRLAQTEDEFVAGLTAVASPVFDHQGRIVAAIAMIAVSGSFDSQGPDAPVNQLRHTAEGISRKLGFDPDNPEGPLVERLNAEKVTE